MNREITTPPAWPGSKPPRRGSPNVAWSRSTGIAGSRAAIAGGTGRNAGHTIIGPKTEQGRVGVVSLAIEGYDPQDVAAILDQNFGIECRAGLHCAPGAHRAIGSFASGGTVRLSFGPFTTDDHIASAIAAVRQIAGSA